MRKMVVFLLSFSLVLGFSLVSSSNANASTKIISFNNCKEMNKVYSGGVARSSNVRNQGGKTYYKPFVSKALYDANSGRDRDGDLIACER